MPVTKQDAPGNTAAKTGEVQQSTGTDQHAPEQTGQGTTPFPADARADQVEPHGYHDSQSGRAVTKDGVPVDQADGTDPIPAHRIVADDWANRPEKA